MSKLAVVSVGVGVLLAVAGGVGRAQQPGAGRAVPLPGRGGTSGADQAPDAPPPQHVRDLRGRLSFDLPAGWNLARHDGEISTFALDARTSLPRTRMDEVAAMAWNPFPYSTFSGALFYVSQTPQSTPLACSNQAVAPASHPVTMPVLDGVTFKHGYAEHGGMCIETRDEVYTTLRGAACLRFDLVINSFCGQASGARELTAGELANLRGRLEGILASVRLTAAPATSGGGKAAVGARLEKR